MTVYRVNEDKDVYLLVKVKRVYAEHDGADHTARRVREIELKSLLVEFQPR